MEDESYPLPRLMAIIKFKLQRPTNAVSHVTSDRFTVSVFKCLFLRTTASSYLFKTWNVYKKVSFFKWCYLLNDSFAFIFHLNVHLLSSTFWHRLIYIKICKKWTYIIFWVDSWSRLLPTNVWKSQKRDHESHHFVPSSLCKLHQEQGWHTMWPKHQIHHKQTLICSSVVKSRSTWTCPKLKFFSSCTCSPSFRDTPAAPLSETHLQPLSETHLQPLFQRPTCSPFQRHTCSPSFRDPPAAPLSETHLQPPFQRHTCSPPFRDTPAAPLSETHLQPLFQTHLQPLFQTHLQPLFQTHLQPLFQTHLRPLFQRFNCSPSFRDATVVPLSDATTPISQMQLHSLCQRHTCSPTAVPLLEMQLRSLFQRDCKILMTNTKKKHKWQHILESSSLTL